MAIVKKKRIYLNLENTKFCEVRLYKDKLDMQRAYEKYKPTDTNHDKIAGVHCGEIGFLIGTDDTQTLLPKTGVVFLCYERCGAGVVSHEFLHAVLWAWRHDGIKKQYPITIDNIDEEEEVAYNLTHAVKQFYNWLYKIEPVMKPA